MALFSHVAAVASVFGRCVFNLGCNSCIYIFGWAWIAISNPIFGATRVKNTHKVKLSYVTCMYYYARFLSLHIPLSTIYCERNGMDWVSFLPRFEGRSLEMARNRCPYCRCSQWIHSRFRSLYRNIDTLIRNTIISFVIIYKPWNDSISFSVVMYTHTRCTNDSKLSNDIQYGSFNKNSYSSYQVEYTFLKYLNSSVIKFTFHRRKNWSQLMQSQNFQYGTFQCRKWFQLLKKQSNLTSSIQVKRSCFTLIHFHAHPSAGPRRWKRRSIQGPEERSPQLRVHIRLHMLEKLLFKSEDQRSLSNTRNCGSWLFGCMTFDPNSSSWNFIRSWDGQVGTSSEGPEKRSSHFKRALPKLVCLRDLKNLELALPHTHISETWYQIPRFPVLPSI